MTAPFRVTKHATTRYRERVQDVDERAAMFCVLRAAIGGKPPSDLQLRSEVANHCSGSRLLYYEPERLMVVIEAKEVSQPCILTCFVAPTDDEIRAQRRARRRAKRYAKKLRKRAVQK